MNDIETGSTGTAIGMRTGAVQSKDGTTIGYRQFGSGPGLVVLHGAMEWSLSHAQLATALADTFTVYLPDRRGRGRSGPYTEDHRVARDVEDVDALLTETGARYVFGVSSGAIIALAAALELDAISKVGVFEPPLFPDEREPSEILDRFDRAMARGSLTSALVVGMKSARMGPAFLRAMPSWLLEPLTTLALNQDDKNASDEYVTMRALAPTLHHDFALALEASGSTGRFSGIPADVLLLEGGASPAYLKAAVEALTKALPKAGRVEFPNAGHGVTGNTDRGGRPDLVAVELRSFFAEETP